jgi:hypothetical protein
MPENGSIVFLMTPGNSIPDYLVNPTAATKVVQELKLMGIKYFLVFAETLDQYRIIGNAIKAAGLQFFSDERWSFEGLIGPNAIGYFDPAQYRQSRIDPFLLPLKREFPASFIGFHFKDEPGLIHLDNLGKLKDCLSSQPEFEKMKVFVNLFPIHANYAALSGLAHSLYGRRQPSEFGVDCSKDIIQNDKLVREMVEGYGAYVRMVMEKIRPDYLCFDLYPFYDGLENCNRARELTMSANLKVISGNAWSANITPIAYLQNFQVEDGFYANFHHLRWFTSWALAFGIKEFSNFISHDGILDEKKSTGLLDSRNEKTKLGGDQQSVFGFLRNIQEELALFRYRGFVAPFLNVMTGDLVGWLPSAEILAGEYLSGNANQVMVFFARRPIEGKVQTEVGLNSWYSRIEQLDVGTGQWALVGQNTNGIRLTLEEWPGALYRLTK